MSTLLVVFEVIVLYGGFILLAVGTLVAIFILGKKLVSKSQTRRDRLVTILELAVLLVLAFAILFPHQFASVMRLII
ncbi:MAG: hypothetical protein V4449_01580 [Patescibacteria group bacterium]